MNDSANQFVGSIPENYDNGLGPNIFIDYADDLARRAGAAGASDVLELAAGTGIVSRRLRDALAPDARLTVTDLNPPMLGVAQAKFSDGEAVVFTPADAMALPFGDAQFDLVVCQFGVMFFPDKTASYREAGFYRVPFSYADPDAVTGDLRAAGWADVEHDTIALDKTVTDFSGFAQGMVFGNPLIDEIRQRGGVEPDDVVAAIIAELQTRWGPEPATMPLQATVFTGRVSG
jgi:SAM-dependent methyltransferase